MTSQIKASMPAQAARPVYSPLAALAVLLVLGTLWGASTNIAKYLAIEGVEPVAYAFWQCAGGAAAMGVVCLARGERLPLAWRHLLFYLVSGGLAIALPNMNMVNVLGHGLPAGVAVLILSTSPIFVYLMATGLGMERFDARRAGGIALGFVGVLTILVPRSSLPDPGLALWAAIAVVTPLCYAIGNVYTARARPELGSSLTHGLGMLLCAACALAPAMLATGAEYVPLAPPRMIDLAMVGQVAITTLATMLWFELVHRSGAVYMSQVGYVVTLTGIGWGWLLHGERLSPMVWLAVLLILAGVALVNLKRPAARV